MEASSIWPIVTNGVIFGVILSATLFTMILVLAKINPEIALRDYPPDVQAKHGPMSDRSKRQRLPVGIFFLVVIFAVLSASFPPILGNIDKSSPFLPAFIHIFVIFSVFNLLDWLVLDWLIVVTLRPEFIVLPGTEGMAGYADYAFHFRGFLIGIPITLVGSLLLAGLVTFLL